MATIEVEVGIDEILWEMSTSEKEDLCQELIEDGHGPGPEDFNDMELDEVLNAETHSERELVALFKEMWSNRLHIDYKLVDELRARLKERNIL
jgi:hypothetical protein